jgi:flavodoxin
VSENDTSQMKPRVLFVYYTHTQQAERVADAMAETLRERGCDVTKASIEFIEPKYVERFSRFPFRHAVFDIVPLALPQLRRKTGQIRIPDEARRADYDLVVVGSPTWFFMSAMPIRSYLKSGEARAVLSGKPFSVYVVCRRYWHWNLNEASGLGKAQGGKYIDGVHFTYEGGQVRSLLSLLSYFGKGEMRERSLGITIPPTNLKPDFGDHAAAFANRLADNLGTLG